MRTVSETHNHPDKQQSLTDLLATFGLRVRRRRNKSQSQVARDAWLDESYVSRLLSGERSHPSRDALIQLGAFGLELEVHELDEVLLAADFRPLVLPINLR